MRYPVIRSNKEMRKAGKAGKDMKNQNTIAKEACKKGIISGGALAGFAAYTPP